MGIGWDLVSLNTEKEQDYFLGVLKERSELKEFWSLHIGPINTNNVWMEGSLFNDKPINYEIRWHTGEPNNVNGNEMCMVATRNNDGTVDMHDMKCEEEISLVCSHIEYL